MQKPIGYIILESPTLSVDLKKVGRSGSLNNRLIVECTLQDMDHTNRNGRTYAREDMLKALKDPRLTELINAGSLKCEDGHPLDKTLSRQQVIYGPLCCAKILSIWIDGDRIKGRVKGTNNDRGEYFNNDILDGELPAWSFRGLGVLQNMNGKVFVKNIRAVTWDKVLYPSHACAYMDKIVSEASNPMSGMGDNKVVYSENWQGELIPVSEQEVIDYVKQESTNLKLFGNSFEILGNQISIVENCTQVQVITNDGSISRIFIEDYIRNEFMDYCSR